jgi:hypothetical protein
MAAWALNVVLIATPDMQRRRNNAVDSALSRVFSHLMVFPGLPMFEMVQASLEGCMLVTASTDAALDDLIRP